MALRVWLPLNGNLNNQGLSNIQINNTGAIINSAGKIGQAYEFGAGHWLRLENYAAEFLTYKEFTLSVWFKCTAQNTSHRGSALISGGNWNQPASLLNLALSGWTTDHYTRLIISGSGTWDAGYNYNFNLNTWYHVALTSGNGKMRAYVNGELIGDSYSAFTPTSLEQDWICVGNGTYYSGFIFNGLMNDIRIYDECLSPRQIKEISKGLIVHYQLKTPRAIDNLKRNVNYGTYNNFASSGSTCTVVKTGETYNGADVWRMTYTPNDTSLSSVQSSLHSHGVTTPGQTYFANTKYCYWTLFKPISHSDTRVGGTASNIQGWTEIAPEYWGDGWYVVGQKRTGNITEDKTDTIFTSFKTPSATSGTPIIIDFCCPHLVEGYDYILEEFDYRGTNPTYEIDSSGNGYNGTINGTLTLSNDTTRYLGSTKFDTNTSYIKLPALTTTGFANSFTISCWSKITDMNAKMRWGFSDGNRLNIYPTGSVICCNTGNSANNPYQNNGTSIGYSQWNGGWHQFVMVADGTTNKLYVDGVYQGTAKTYVGLTGTQIYISGWDAGTSYTWTDGLMNDFRIYATALSSDDIKELYQTSGIIDNKGNAYSYEFKEE